MKGKVVIITGATSGIGLASSRLFAAAGAIVIAVGRSAETLAEIEVAGDSSGSIHAHAADVAQPADVDKLIRDTVDGYGQIDVLINAAGIMSSGSVETTTLPEWDRSMDINLRAAFYLTQRCVPFLEVTRGCVVNVSSVAGTRSFPNVLAYCVSKAALDQLTRCSALELAPKGIRVNAVNPGVVVTNLHTRGGMDADQYEAFLEHSKTTHPLGRVGTADEIAELIHFLASDRAAWITGGTYAIDGGRSLTCAR
jgi:NAD(P)-dependent dehydrogenase (short-subunit alcohol dehydrogenase family)